LLYIERQFEEALKSVKLTDTHILFIDGIDIRPESTSFEEYLDCVKGLANAVWSLNNDVFPRIADSPGRMRIVLLLRPDIFNSLGMLNRNTKLKDNSVVLSWNTKYGSHRESDIFKLADRMFLAQQEEPHSVGECWDHYLPFDATNFRMDASGRSSFVTLLRYSFHRPRDILSILDTLYEVFVRSNPDKKKFEPADLSSPEFRSAYSDYFLGEIRDNLSFYYNTEEFEAFLKFFEYLNGKQKFSYEEYLDSFTHFIGFLSGQAKKPPSFMRSPEEFLQFLFDLNVICYIEHADNERFFHWCFIDRTVTNISPKVKTNMEYEIHYGLSSALNLGKPLKPRKMVTATNENETFPGYVIKYHSDKRYGFLKSPDFSGQVFFHIDSFTETVLVKKGLHVTFKAGVGRSGKLAAVDIKALSVGDAISEPIRIQARAAANTQDAQLKSLGTPRPRRPRRRTKS
jgi:cold shock CspA family protein